MNKKYILLLLVMLVGGSQSVVFSGKKRGMSRRSDVSKKTYCEACRRYFRRGGAFASHCRGKSHKRQLRKSLASESLVSDSTPEQEEYRCGLCGECFRYDGELVEHLWRQLPKNRGQRLRCDSAALIRKKILLARPKTFTVEEFRRQRASRDEDDE